METGYKMLSRINLKYIIYKMLFHSITYIKGYVKKNVILFLTWT